MIAIGNSAEENLDQKVNFILENSFHKVRSILEKYSGWKFRFNNDLLNSLRDGQILCRFMNGLWPDIITEINPITTVTNKANIGSFLDVANYIMKDEQVKLFKFKDFKEPSIKGIDYEKFAELKLKRFMNVLNGLLVFITYIESNYDNLSISINEIESSKLSDSHSASYSYPVKYSGGKDGNNTDTNLSVSEAGISLMCNACLRHGCGHVIFKPFNTVLTMNPLVGEFCLYLADASSLLESSTIILCFLPQIKVQQYSSLIDAAQEIHPFETNKCFVDVQELELCTPKITDVTYTMADTFSTKLCIALPARNSKAYNNETIVLPLISSNLSSSRKGTPLSHKLSNSNNRNYSLQSVYSLSTDVSSSVCSLNDSIEETNSWSSDEISSNSNNIKIISCYGGELFDHLGLSGHSTNNECGHKENGTVNALKTSIVMNIDPPRQYIVNKDLFRTDIKIQIDRM